MREQSQVTDSPPGLLQFTWLIPWKTNVLNAEQTIEVLPMANWKPLLSPGGECRSNSTLASRSGRSIYKQSILHHHHHNPCSEYSASPSSPLVLLHCHCMQLSTTSLYPKAHPNKAKQGGTCTCPLVTSQGGQQNLYLPEKSLLHHDYPFKDTETKPKQGLLFHICYEKVCLEILLGDRQLRGSGDFLARSQFRRAPPLTQNQSSNMGSRWNWEVLPVKGWLFILSHVRSVLSHVPKGYSETHLIQDY